MPKGDFPFPVERAYWHAQKQAHAVLLSMLETDPGTLETLYASWMSVEGDMSHDPEALELRGQIGGLMHTIQTMRGMDHLDYLIGELKAPPKITVTSTKTSRAGK